LRRRRVPTLPLLFALTSAPTLAACGIRLSQRAAGSGLSAEPEREAPRIDVTAAYEAINAGKAVLFDVRGAEPFRQRRAKGAVLLAVDDIEHAPAEAVRRIPADKRPILYCT
jgi:hypothetical protein